MTRLPQKTPALRLAILGVLFFAVPGCIWVHSDKHEDVYHHDDPDHIDPDHH